jgi:predicted PurR-regulated permease PerM
MKKTNVFLLIILFIVGISFITSIHAVITPFLLAATLSYFVFPLVIIIENKTKWSRTVSVIIVYFILINIVFVIATLVTLRLHQELNQVADEYRMIDKQLVSSIQSSPEWIRPVLLDNIQQLNVNSLFNSRRLWPYFTGALSGIGSLFIFLVATFYFLKEGDNFAKSAIQLVIGGNQKVELTILKIRQVLDGYLRGQSFLILLMATISFVILALLNVKYAFLLGLFTGFAEIVPFIGPIAATTVVSIVVMLDGISIFNLPPSGEVILIISIYFILRQLEDYFVIPYVMGRVTKLHPLVILFLVLVGGHIWGVFGMILAIPVAAVIRLLFVTNQVE